VKILARTHAASPLGSRPGLKFHSKGPTAPGSGDHVEVPTALGLGATLEVPTAPGSGGHFEIPTTPWSGDHLKSSTAPGSGVRRRPSPACRCIYPRWYSLGVDPNLVSSPFMPKAPWTAHQRRKKNVFGASLSTAAIIELGTRP